MHMKKAFNTALALTLACSMVVGSMGIDARAAGSTANVSIDNSKVSIGNDYISREFSIENGKIKTSSVLNKRANTNLIPGEGSEDFIIQTLTDATLVEDEDGVITNDPVYEYTEGQALDRTNWSATLENKDETQFSETEVNKLFDGDLSTHVDNWQISGNPFTLKIDFGSAQTFSGMSVDKRPGYSDVAYGVNGTMGGYEIWTSTDGESYTKVAEGEFTESDYNLHEVTQEAANAVSNEVTEDTVANNDVSTVADEATKDIVINNDVTAVPDEAVENTVTNDNDAAVSDNVTDDAANDAADDSDKAADDAANDAADDSDKAADNVANDVAADSDKEADDAANDVAADSDKEADDSANDVADDSDKAADDSANDVADDSDKAADDNITKKEEALPQVKAANENTRSTTLYNVGDTVYASFDEVTAQYVKVVQTSAAIHPETEEFSSAEINFYSGMQKHQKVEEPTQALDRTGWTVSIRNSAGTEFDATHVARLIDGNLNTHPDEYSKSGHPITVDINLGEAKTIRSFSIDKRPGYSDAAYGTNGTMGSFELYVSDDGETYTKAGAGEFTKEAYNLHDNEDGSLHNVGDRVYANFHKPYTTQYVRLVQTGVAFGDAQEFTSAELNLYEDQYVGPNWNTALTEEVPEDQRAINSSSLTFKEATQEDVDGGKKLTISYEPYTLNNVTYNISQVLVLKDNDPYMRSFLEISVDDKENARIDYIDTDRFVLPDDATGIWCRPEDSKISSMWIGKHELMLGQPIYVNGFFMGCEFPAADTIIDNHETQIRYYSGKNFTKLEEDNQLTTDGKFVTWQNVIGAASGTDTAVVQTDFFSYIEEIATPTEFRKQYNSWYDNMMSITDESIAASFNGAEAGLTQNGVEPLDSYVVDDGWNNYYSKIGETTYVGASTDAGSGTPNQTGFWEFNNKFPDELYTSSALADKFNATFGVWVGPQGGYNYFGGFAQYLEAMGTGEVQSNSALGTVICTGSRKYLDNFEKMAIDYQNRFNVEYWKWDGFASRPCNNPEHDHMTGGDNNMYFTSDMWEAWTDLFEHVRENNPDLFINATCYVNLSPWLLQWVNTIWVQDSGDTGQLGTGERHEQKIYYRDQVYYQLYKQNQIQFPLKNIYNHDPIFGVSDGSDATTEVFREFLMANAMRGTAFWELYYSPSLMDDAKWKVTADVLAWAEDNHEILKNAKLFGNQPKNGVYGYSCWNGNEGIVSFTNPLDSEQTYTLTMDEIVGVPKTVKALTGIQVEPYREGTLANKLTYGDELSVTLQPHETLIYQYGHEDTAAPEIVSAKVTDDHSVTLKFDERICLGEFTLNGKAATAELKEDYRTVVLTTEDALDGTCEASVKNVTDFNGNTANQTLTLSCYDNGVIALVKGSDDVTGEETIKTGYDAMTDTTWMKDLNKAYEADSRNTLNGKEDFTISTGVKTTSSGVNLVKSGNDVSLSINNEGYVEFKVNGLTLTSAEEVTTVTEKAHGTFGTEEYVPTAFETTTIGKVNDGEIHAIDAVREANGMLKLYIDGKLASTLYDEAHLNEAVTGGKITVADNTYSGDLAQVEVLNRALAYDEVHTYDTTGNDRVISDREGWTAEACSEMSGMSGDASAMATIDGNNTSWWHTNYVGGDDHAYGTHWIEINFNREEAFDRFIYTGRGSGSNGSIKDYKLELLDKDGNVTETFTGAFSADNATSEVDLGEVKKAYGARLTALTTHNGKNFAAAVEINISRPITILSGEELQTKAEEILTVNKVENISYENYTTVTAKAMKAIVDKFNSLERATEADLIALTAELQEAKAALVNTAALNEAIAKADTAKANEEKYEKDSFNAMIAAYEKAKEAAYGGTAEEVAAAEKALSDAVNMLVEAEIPTPPTPVDKTALKDQIDQANALKKADYTAETWSELEKALNAAQAVFEAEDSTQAQVDDALNALTTAYENLKPVDVPGPVAETKIEINKGLKAEDIPEELKDTYDTPDKLEDAMKVAITKKNTGLSKADTAVYDVTLMYSEDNGKTWVKADKEHFPTADGKLEVTIPYPEGTGKDTHDFVVAHMFTTSDFGKTIGDIEYPEVRKTAEGLEFYVTGLSPISVGWTKISQTPGDTPGSNPGSSSNTSGNNSGSGSSSSSSSGSSGTTNAPSGSGSTTAAPATGSGASTGDTMNMGMWFCTMMVAAMVALVMYRKRKQF